MLRGISTHIFLQQRLHAGLLDAMVAGGAQAIEIFAARHHLDYTDRAEVKEIAKWFRSNDCRATLHQPLYDGVQAPAQWSRHVPTTLNLIAQEKTRRIEAMDETKRALEIAEQIDIDSIVLHLGTRDDEWGERTLDLAMTAIEHIKAFAHPLGVKTLIETLPSPVTMPEHLLDILRIGHLDTVGVCLDVGHMNLPGMPPVREAFQLLGKRIAEVHLHDNGGERDEHCWPGEGTVNWADVQEGMSTLAGDVKGMLEIHFLPETDAKAMSEHAARCFRELEARGSAGLES